MKSFPMQPIVLADDGVIRFQENRIIRDLLKTSTLDLNDIARAACSGKYNDAEEMQLAQLLGYSVSGFGDLRCADRDVVRRADQKASKLNAELDAAEKSK